MRSKAQVCGRLPAGIAGSNATGGMDVCVVCSTVRTKDKSQENQDKNKYEWNAKTEKEIPPME